MSDQNPNPSKVEELQEIVRTHLKHGLPDKVQEELAYWLISLPELSKNPCPITIKSAEMMIKSLLSESPNVLLSRDFREATAVDMKWFMKKTHMGRLHHYLLSNLRGSTAPIKVVKGLVSFLILAVLGLIIWQIVSPQSNLWELDSGSVRLIAFFGGLGGVISIMVRLHDFIPHQRTDPAILFLTGFFKPIVGTSMALFVYFAVESGVVALAIEPVKDPEKLVHFFYALAFLSGFSERFMRDIISQIKAGGSDARN